MKRLVAVAVLSIMIHGAGVAANEALSFAVYLDNREIGTHRYQFAAVDNGYELISEASYDVKFLFINAYSYRHRSEELWQNGCLVAISSRTDANGEEFRVDSEQDEQTLVLSTAAGATSVTGSCPRTFAYWDRELLATTELINSQTGELAGVELVAQGSEALPWNGDAQARAFVLRNPEADIHLWYDDQDNWLGLRSTLDNGRILSYRRSDISAAAMP